MKSLKLNYIAIIVGGALLVTGLYLAKSLINPQGIMLSLPYVCIGLGCGILAMEWEIIFHIKQLKVIQHYKNKLV